MGNQLNKCCVPCQSNHLESHQTKQVKKETKGGKKSLKSQIPTDRMNRKQSFQKQEAQNCIKQNQEMFLEKNQNDDKPCPIINNNHYLQIEDIILNNNSQKDAGPLIQSQQQNCYTVKSSLKDEKNSSNRHQQILLQENLKQQVNYDKRSSFGYNNQASKIQKQKSFEFTDDQDHDIGSNHNQNLKSLILSNMINNVKESQSNQDQMNFDLSEFSTKSRLASSKLNIIHFQNEILSKKFSTEDIYQVYKVGKLIGKGKFGCVRLAYHYQNPNKKLAIKSVLREAIQDHIHLIEDERDIMRDLDHPSIIKMYETYMDKNYFHFVMEHCDGGDLFEKIQQKERFSEYETAFIIENLLQALNHCHLKNICHRDLKPENIVFKKKAQIQKIIDIDQGEGEIKIIDFGLAKYLFKGQNLKSKVGTPYYVAPEVLESNYDHRCDNWSVGVITYTLICGYPPFFADNHQEIFRKIKSCEFTFNPVDWQGASPELLDFINRLIVKDRDRRMTAKKALQHPWIQNFRKRHKQNLKSISQQYTQDLLNRLKAFKRSRQIKKEAIKILIRVVEDQQVSETKQGFNQIDQNGIGVLNTEVLQQAFDKSGQRLSKTEIQDMISKIKQNTNQSLQKENPNQGGIDLAYQDYMTFTDFLMATLDTRNLTKHQLWTVFKHLDTNHTGYISFKGLVKAFNRNDNCGNSEERALGLMTELNMSKDDKLSFDRFCSLILTQNSFCADLNESLPFDSNNFDSSKNNQSRNLQANNAKEAQIQQQKMLKEQSTITQSLFQQKTYEILRQQSLDFFELENKIGDIQVVDVVSEYIGSMDMQSLVNNDQ
eukprot:403350571